MYTFEESVFVVWGGNKKLAEKVSQRLNGRGLRAIIGGDVNSSDDSSYLGPRILEQMDGCSRAIVLAEPEYDPGSGRYFFRENLMFEWGYLLRRLPKGAITVYIIGADRNALPSDLQGAFTQVVPKSITEIPGKASWIVSNYRANYAEIDTFAAFDMLLRWDEWQHFIDHQIGRKSAPQPKLLRRVLVSSILPVQYNEDFDYFDRVMQRLDYTGPVDSEYLAVAKTSMLYWKTARQFGIRHKPGTFDGIKHKISALSGHKDEFLAAIARHFMALCLRNESMLTYPNADKARFLKYSISHFEEVERYFERARIDERTRDVWLAYVRGSLAKSLFEVGERDRCISLMSQQLEGRRRVGQHLLHSRVPRIYQNYLAETYIHQMRLHRLTGEVNDVELQELLEAIRSLKQESAGYMWKLLELEISKSGRKID